MKQLLLTMSLLMLSATAFAEKNCEELKAEISAKMKANGVASFTLHIVAADDAVASQVVGTCEGGKKKIVYTRT